MHNVLFVSHTAELGGAEHSLLLLLERMDRSRFVPTVALPGRGPLRRRLERMGVPCRDVPTFRLRRTRNPAALARFFAGWVRARRRLAGLVDELRADIVHCNSTTAFLFGSVRGRVRRPRLVWHVRDVSLTGLVRFDRALAARADAVLAISQAIRATVPEAPGVGEKTVVIPNGVDTETFAPRDAARLRRELGLGETTPVAGIVGQVVPWKGHGRFLEAAAAVARRRPDARFLVVGDNRFGDHPDLLNRLRARARDLGLGDRVVFTGWRDDVPDVMNALDVLVLASENEPFGRVVIEAMACAKPVVAFRCGGPVEIIEDGRTGFLVEPFDVGAMADSIDGLLGDRDRAAAMGRVGRRAACERFSAGACAAKVQEVYERLLQRGTPDADRS